MDENVYVKDVAVIARNKGWKIIVDEPFGIDSNALNPAGVLVIEKNQKLKVIVVRVNFVVRLHIQHWK
ncbi:hypothetical protein [uncultured Selenomonas sp.]|uniref:hypothetical protein n=1 Tax=uncultured Selenomonas sp. TaxID=159275 RepID=UPI0028DD0DA1|nr:hypothetical protein [uncultured Selenomonas sp.]